MTPTFLGDALGPRGRRRALVASVVSGAALAGFIAVAVSRLADKGQLEREKWEPLTDREVLEFLLGGLGNTVKAALFGMVGAVVLGALLALARLARTRLLRWPSRLYTEFFRGFPLLLLVLFAFFGLPRLGIDLPKIWYLVLALVAYNGAVLGEIFRAGILSLDSGQSEAASAIGLRYWQSMRLVILPQAMRRMTPAIVSQLVTLLKDTSLGFVVGFEELLRRARISGEFDDNELQALVVATFFYFLVNFTLSQAARRLEVRQRRRFGAGGMAVPGVEDLAIVGAQAEATLS